MTEDELRAMLNLFQDGPDARHVCGFQMERPRAGRRRVGVSLPVETPPTWTEADLKRLRFAKLLYDRGSINEQPV